ncbi:MAG: hypothetical protein AB199_03925 [Parcubacteria bacterium C7867-004]|nr:MAG: hypothetical protein AB199_03925 [Parcubacteria bacterium C7867-004]
MSLHFIVKLVPVSIVEDPSTWIGVGGGDTQVSGGSTDPPYDPNLHPV